MRSISVRHADGVQQCRSKPGRGPAAEAFGSYFLDVFDRPPALVACECARSNGANLSSVLHLTTRRRSTTRSVPATAGSAGLVQNKTTPDRAVEDI